MWPKLGQSPGQRKVAVLRTLPWSRHYRSSASVSMQVPEPGSGEMVAAKGTCGSCRGLRFDSQHTCGSSQQFVAPFSGNLTFPSDLSSSKHMYGADTYIQAKCSCTLKAKNEGDQCLCAEMNKSL